MNKETALEVIKRDLEFEKCVKIVKKQPNCCLAPRVNAINIIEKELKALEIIKNKKVDVALFVKSKNAVDYNGLRMIMFRKQAERDYSGVLLKYGLTQEEYGLLKEVML